MKQTSLLALLALASLTAGAKAQIIEIDSRTAFNSEVTGQTTENFESPGISGYPDGDNPRNLTTFDSGYIPPSGIGSFTLGGGGSFFYAGSPSPNGLYGGDGSYYISTPGSGNALTFTLANPESAAGSDIFSAGSPTFTGGTVIVTEQNSLGVQDSTTFSFGAPAATGSPSDTFLGFIASKGETLVSISYQGPDPTDYVAFDNYSVGNAVATPEPSTYALLLAGGALLVVLRRRRATNS